MKPVSRAAGLIRRTRDMARLLGGALDRAEMLGDAASHRQAGSALAALRDALTQDVFPIVLELDCDSALVDLHPALLSGMQRRGILRRYDDWHFLDRVCDRAPAGLVSAADMEEAADRLIAIEARARGWIVSRLNPGQRHRPIY